MLASPVQAQDEAGFQTYMQTLSRQAAAAGVRQSTIDAVIPQLTYNPRVVELDRQQPESNPNAPIPNYEQYRRTHVDANRISRGRAAYQRVRWRLQKIEAETGVPESIMVAIWGNETNYGTIMGGFDLPRSLATLAYEGRRRDLFASEFIATLKMIDRGVPREKLVGSWAGAFGGPQFLPSVYLRTARDGDGDGLADIWASEPDTLASIAAYFVDAGWRKGQPWGFAVNVPATLDRGGIDGPGKTGYLLTGNYRVILDYNCSNFYALSVGLLSDEVSR
jgi:lytic murein transglycosylase